MTAGMLADPQLDPMGSLIRELTADPDVAALVGVRVRGFQPGPGDAKGPGEYQAFIVLTALSVPPHPRVPVTFAEYGIRCYGATPQGAWAVWGAVVKALHQVGPRTKSNGLLFYRTFVLTGGQQDRDPDTAQPVVTGSIRLTASLQSVT
jgi:hypothetical protein